MNGLIIPEILDERLVHHCCDTHFREGNRQVMSHRNGLYAMVYSFPSEQIREACHLSSQLIDVGDTSVVTISTDLLKVWVRLEPVAIRANG